MPTEAFFKLERDRKDRLLQSAISEFSQMPYEKVSVFKIAENAGISRSTFYYYFKGKDDIYHYLLLQIKQAFMDELEREQQQYDIFSFCRKVFDFLTDLKGTKNEAFFKQVTEDMKPEDLNEFFERLETCAGEKHFAYLCDLEDLKIASCQELMGLAFLLACVTMFSLKSYLGDKMSLNEAINTLDKMYDMIKYGVLK